MFVIQGCSSPPLNHWHTERLTEEFTADMLDDQVSSFDDYLALEQRLFTQLDEKVYAETGTGPGHALQRYSRGSMADPATSLPNWNRSFELNNSPAVGGVLLLHGMSDSPYSLRALGEALNKQGYLVVGLRAPGHGTAPSSLVLISPAIRVHSAAAIAGFKDALSGISGLDSLAYLAVMDEFDPYKYNSFATNSMS